MADAVQHAAHLRVVLHVDAVADPAQAERAQRVELALVRAVGGLELGDLHDVAFPPAAAAISSASTPASASVPAIISAATSSLSPPRPSTRLIDRPRSSATSSGRRRPWRPATVALTRLIGFWEPSDLERM